MTQLTPHFSLEELTHSNTGEANGIDNTAPPEIQARLTALCLNILESIRDYFNLPVTVLSGYRCSRLNALLGGKDASQHLTGEAADITIHGIPNIDVFQYIRKNLPFDQLIAERLSQTQPNAGWIHVSYVEPTGRKDALTFDGKRYSKWVDNAGN